MADTVINILTDDTINKIAAGEVIENPASIVRELVENSLDAGADRISVHLENGGKDAIQVADNGCGIPAAELPKTWLRHATSKINRAEDLESVKTMGFRGEALSSISAVAKLQIETRHACDATGSELILENSSETDCREISRATGTTVTVKELFRKIPVRQKFLGNGQSELRKILKILTRIALANPAVSFSLSENGKSLRTFTVGDLKNRVGEVLGNSAVTEMVPLDWRDPADRIRVSGFAGAPGQFRKQRSSQYFFINGRNVFSPVAARALSSAYDNPQPGTHPAAVLFLSLPSGAVDVNIHPAKKEVRLQDEGLVFTAVRNAVRHALRERYQAPGLQLGASTLAPDHFPPTRDSHAFHYVSANEDVIALDEKPVQSTLFLNEAPEEKEGRIYQWPEATGGEEAVERDARRGNGLSPQPVPYMQLHNCYILFEVQSGLMVVSQEAAHERILYEQALETFRCRGKLSSQQLLFPEILEIDVESALTIENHVESFRSLGFELECFGGNTFQVRGIPSEVSQNEAMTVILTMVKDLEKSTRKQDDISTGMALAFARGACIKQGKILTYPEMAHLIDKLFAARNPYMSPTGKTVILRYKIEEFHRRFGRR